MITPITNNAMNDMPFPRQEQQERCTRQGNPHNQNQSLWQENEKLRTLIKRKDTELSQSKQYSDELQRSNHQHIRTVQALKREIQGMETSINSAKQYSRSIERTITSSCSKLLVEKHSQLKKRYQLTMETLREKDETITRQATQIKKDEKEIQVLLRALEIRVEDLGFNMNKQQSQRGDRRAEIRAGLLYELSSAQQQKSDIEAANRMLLDQLEALKRDHHTLLTRLDVEESTKTELEQDINTFRSQSVQEEMKLQELTKEKETIRAQFHDMLRRIEDQSETITSLTEEGKDQNSKLIKLEESLQVSEGETNDLKAKVAELEALCSQRTLVATQTHARAQDENQRALSAESRVLDMERATHMVQEERDSAARAQRLVEERSAQMERELVALRGELAQWEQKGEVMERLIDEDKKNITVIESEHESVVSQSRRLKQELEALQVEYRASETAKSELLDNKLQSDSRIAVLQAELKQLEKSKELLQRAMLEQLAHARQELREEKEAKQNSSSFNHGLRSLTSESAKLDKLLSEHKLATQRQDSFVAASQSHLKPISLSSLAGVL